MSSNKLFSYHAFLKLPAVFIFLTVWFLSSQPNLVISERFRHADKVVHFFAYAFLAGSLCFWVPTGFWSRFPFLCALFVVALSAVLGALDEYHQSFVPGRDASVDDWLADVIGSVIGVASFLRIRQVWHRFRAKS